MKNNNISLQYVRETDMDIRELEQTLLWKRNQAAALHLSRAGFLTRMESKLAGKFMYILVYHPSGGLNEWATAEEAEHLADFAANLSPEQAWERWQPTIEAFHEYTDREIVQMDRETARELERQEDHETARMIRRDAAVALGSIRSERKAASSAANGRKGGRPKKSE